MSTDRLFSSSPTPTPLRWRSINLPRFIFYHVCSTDFEEKIGGSVKGLLTTPLTSVKGIASSLSRVKGEVKAHTIFDFTFDAPQSELNPIYRPMDK